MANDNLFAMNMVNPKTYYFSFAKFIPILLLISVASMHIAAAGVALLCYGVVCLASLMQLANPQALMPIVFSHGFAPSGFVMTLFSLGAGALFGRPMWGAYWIWDSRLLLILLVFFAAFISLSASKVNHKREVNDKRASISAILGVIVVPVLYVFFDLFTPMAHDLENSLIRSNGRDAYVLMSLFMLNLFTYSLAMALSRCRTVILERERRAIWAQDAALEGEL